jgi:16S rRNA (guanine966-N2)-methyltransferase
MLGSLAGTTVLDLYAGSGAVGLEALSRGASDVLLIESDRKAAQVIRHNMNAVGLPGARLIQDRVERVLKRGSDDDVQRRLVFADPPYSISDDQLAEALVMLATGGWLATDALLIVERDARSGPVAWPTGYSLDRSRRYGETTLWYGRASGGTPAAAASTTGA